MISELVVNDTLAHLATNPRILEEILALILHLSPTADCQSDCNFSHSDH